MQSHNKQQSETSPYLTHPTLRGVQLQGRGHQLQRVTLNRHTKSIALNEPPISAHTKEACKTDAGSHTFQSRLTRFVHRSKI